jgi:hypothetical protein
MGLALRSRVYGRTCELMVKGCYPLQPLCQVVQLGQSALSVGTALLMHLLHGLNSVSAQLMACQQRQMLYSNHSLATQAGGVPHVLIIMAVSFCPDIMWWLWPGFSSDRRVHNHL